ncbi:MAG: elongation factor Ts, partial [bacterium]|nr:elongation factor Ts [bacterium]
ADREVSEGWIDVYVHANGKVAAMVKLGCETDFVARNSDFKELAHDIAMQVAATNPLAISEADQGEGVDGADVLMNQEFIKDNAKTIRNLVEEATAKIGEKIEIAEFKRMEI